MYDEAVAWGVNEMHDIAVHARVLKVVDKDDLDEEQAAAVNALHKCYQMEDREPVTDPAFVVVSFKFMGLMWPNAAVVMTSGKDGDGKKKPIGFTFARVVARANLTEDLGDVIVRIDNKKDLFVLAHHYARGKYDVAEKRYRMELFTWVNTRDKHGKRVPVTLMTYRARMQHARKAEDDEDEDEDE
jgi:hypothetical protein